jgi:ribosome-associated protein
MGRPTPDDLLRAGDLSFEFLRSSGPGGQNVNKVETAVRLRLDVSGTRLLSPGVKARLGALAGHRMTSEGTLVIEARRHRTQEGNRRDALERLAELLQGSWCPPRPRLGTLPTRAARRRRLDQKRERGAVKRQRKGPSSEEC